MNKIKVACLVQAFTIPTVYMVLAISSVHDRMPIRTKDEEFGWMVAVYMLAIGFIPVVIAFIAGRSYEKSNQKETSNEP